MRWISASLLSLALWALLGPVGCGSAHVPTPPPDELALAEPDPPPRLDRFSAARAFADLGALVSIGPRVSGTPGAERAREYLRSQLAAAGLAVEEIESPRPLPAAAEALEDVPGTQAAEPFRHLSVVLPGASPAQFVLATPYDTSRIAGIQFVGANDGASGAALLLELARVLSQRSLPYTTRLLFLDGEGGADPIDGAPGRGRWQGSESLAAQLDRIGELDAVRLLVAFHQVCDADLRIARDLSSHRMYREEFFRTADRLGRTRAFPRDEGFESVEASHLAFRAHGVRSAVAITDTRYGGDGVPGIFAGTADDTIERCAPESLEAVGSVTLAALETIGERLTKIDRFARSPVAELETLASEGDSETLAEEASDASGGEDTDAATPVEDAAAQEEPPSGEAP